MTSVVFIAKEMLLAGAMRSLFSAQGVKGRIMVLKSCMAVFLLTAAMAGTQQSSVPVVQPGAPGQASRTLPAGTKGEAPKVSKADIDFMQGMVMHHAQAVEMTELLKAKGQDKDVQELGKRIRISQTDEMGYMKHWLEAHGHPVSKEPTMAEMDMNMAGMDMSSMPMMPGMLTPAQMDALKKASGAQFDHLFLTGMIQHHTGALVMVDELFASPGAGQDSELFDFATDVDNTQKAEIRIMQGLLNKEKQ